MNLHNPILVGKEVNEKPCYVVSDAVNFWLIWWPYWWWPNHLLVHHLVLLGKKTQKRSCTSLRFLMRISYPFLGLEHVGLMLSSSKNPTSLHVLEKAFRERSKGAPSGALAAATMLWEILLCELRPRCSCLSVSLVTPMQVVRCFSLAAFLGFLVGRRVSLHVDGGGERPVPSRAVTSRAEPAAEFLQHAIQNPTPL